MLTKARVAVIGTGWWSTYTHIPGLRANPQAELVALCDTNADKLHAAAKTYRVERVYTSAGAMLDHETLDGVVIATHHATHAALAQACLARGLHVMLEKPMTLHAAEARALVALARAQGRELIIGYPWHFTRQALRARELVRPRATAHCSVLRDGRPLRPAQRAERSTHLAVGVLERYGRASRGELARLLTRAGISEPSIKRHFRRLVADGIIIEVPVDGDRRKFYALPCRVAA